MSDPPSQARAEALACLQSLSRLHRDAHEGFSIASQHAADSGIKQLFTQCALERATMAADLKLLELQHGQPMDEGDGTLMGNLHRTWINLGSGAANQADPALLEEGERTGQTAVTAYLDALAPHSIPLPRSITTVLERHLIHLQATQEEILQQREVAAQRLEMN